MIDKYLISTYMKEYFEAIGKLATEIEEYWVFQRNPHRDEIDYLLMGIEEFVRTLRELDRREG